jgi:NifU-like protein involved in Fe-S cluster formation
VNYSESTQRRFDAAVNAGTLSGPGVWRGAAGSRARGTWVQFDLRVDAGHIQAARFLAFACPHTIAVADFIAGQAAGLALGPELPESVQSLQARFEVPNEKLGRLLTVEDAWRAAIGAGNAAAGGT